MHFWIQKIDQPSVFGSLNERGLVTMTRSNIFNFVEEDGFADTS
jgi:hypothetical protein